jgi:tetratricopeptide (TPR) repeat protein
LAKSDPSNAGWQRDLSVSHIKVGDVLADQGNLTDALKSYREGLDIAERLANGDPGNMGWQRDLAVANERVGHTYLARKETDAAKAAFERVLAAYTQLLTKAPDSTSALVGSAVAMMQLGALHGPDGGRYLEQALAILKRLDETGQLEPRYKSSIGWIEARLAKLQEAQASPK